MIAKNFWEGKRVFITGHTGFKGSWLTQCLLRLGADVSGYSLPPPTSPALFDLLSLSQEVRHNEGDVRDASKLLKALSSFRPDVVFHLAAQPIVRQSYRDPRGTFDTNIMGTVNLLDAVRMCDSVRSVVVVTSDKCYENREWDWGYRENDPMGGYDPYSASKGCAELVIASYRNSFFSKASYGNNHHVALASSRAGNVIGGGDWAEDRLIPDCVRALSRGEEIVIRSPRAVRPWQLVLEPLAGYLRLAALLYLQGPEYAEAWNFGPGDSGVLDVESIVKLVVSEWGSGSYRIADDADLHEAQLLKLDISKARAGLKWVPKLFPAEAIAWTVEAYKNYYLEGNITDCIGKQISTWDL